MDDLLYLIYRLMDEGFDLIGGAADDPTFDFSEPTEDTGGTIPIMYKGESYAIRVDKR